MNKETSVILEMLRHIVNQPNSTQRDLARGLNLSLGKVNISGSARNGVLAIIEDKFLLHNSHAH